MNNVLLDHISNAFFHPDGLPLDKQNALLDEFLEGLENGSIRCAQKSSEKWIVDPRVKQGILLAFRLGQKRKYECGPLTFIDKENIGPRHFYMDDNVRIVPGGTSVRRGAFIGGQVVIMPPAYVNIGAFVDEASLIDSHALVGSCAQIGKRVHLSAGAQIGGVLEPISGLPVIIEDDAFIGGNSGLYEGVQIGEKAVIGAGVILTKSTKVYDMVHNREINTQDENLSIPPYAVVVPGTRSINSDFARNHGLSLSCALIIKYRDEKTSQKTKIEDLLRT
jgi:2,3,4,5-tetrahydropyridine-2-carboxylate N-succinyltransferase